ncbi:MAG: hypothetical protein M1822_008391 [Bathelium mastoideum]|nr:MAG: hypothetical protein M1822_008391 [Bathelium mastoideum]
MTIRNWTFGHSSSISSSTSIRMARARRRHLASKEKLNRRRWRLVSKLVTFVHVLLRRNVVRESRIVGSPGPVARISNSESDPSHHSYTPIRSGSRVVNSDGQITLALGSPFQNLRVHYQRAGRLHTREYLTGSTVLSVRNTIKPIHPSSSTGKTDSTIDFADSRTLERHRANERANAQSQLEGRTIAPALPENSKSVDDATRKEHRNGSDGAHLSHHVSADVTLPMSASAAVPSSRGVSEVHGRDQNAGPQDPIEHDSATEDSGLNNIPPPLPPRSHHHSAAHPDGLLVLDPARQIGIAIGSPSSLGVRARKPLPARAWKARSRGLGWHPDSLRLRRGSAQGNTGEREDEELVPQALKVAKRTEGNVDVHKSLPAVPETNADSEGHESDDGPGSSESLVAPQLCTEIPSPGLDMDFAARIFAEIPSPQLHLDFGFSSRSASVAVDSVIGEDNAFAVAFSPTDWPLAAEPAKAAEKQAQSAHVATASPESRSNKPLPPTPEAPIANFGLSIFSLPSTHASSAPSRATSVTVPPVPDLAILPATTYVPPSAINSGRAGFGSGTRELEPVSDGGDEEPYEAYQLPFARVPTKLRSDRRREQSWMARELGIVVGGQGDWV